MQVEGQKSRFFRSSNKTREDKDGRRKDKRYIGLADSERS